MMWDINKCTKLKSTEKMKPIAVYCVHTLNLQDIYKLNMEPCIVGRQGGKERKRGREGKIREKSITILIKHIS